MGADDTTPLWPSMSAVERATAYSPSTMVGGDLGPFIQAYVDQSKVAYAALSNIHTLAYGEGQSQTLDLAIPDARQPIPLHVFIHGGYWQELSKTDSFFPAPGTLSQGIAFAALDYTLAPDANMDEIVTEVTTALRYLREHAEALGIDPTRIVVSGSSAGAHLAAMACLNLADTEQPAGLILLSGIFDLRPLLDTYVNDALGMDDDSARRNSPALQDLSNLPPTLVAWAQNDTDEFKRQSCQFAALLDQTNRVVNTLEVPGRNHFDIVHDLTNNTALGQWLPRLAQHEDPHNAPLQTDLP